MTSPIDWNRAARARDTLRHPSNLRVDNMAEEIARTSAAYDEMFQGLRSRDEYIEHLERCLTELRSAPTSLFGTLGVLQDAGVEVFSMEWRGGIVVGVMLVWPGDSQPTEHRTPDAELGNQARFAAELREYAASRQAQVET
jgi:hypothetical protein